MSNAAWRPAGPQHHSVERLKAQLFSVERMPVRDESERRLRDNDAANLRREIELLESGKFKVGHP